MKATDARSRKSLVSYGLSALLAIGAFSAQVATAMTPDSSVIDDTGSYPSEVQHCMSGQTQQSRADCMKERATPVPTSSAASRHPRDLQANALARCDVHQASDEKAACQARVLGMGPHGRQPRGRRRAAHRRDGGAAVGQHSVTVQPQTSEPIVLVPSQGTSTLGNR